MSGPEQERVARAYVAQLDAAHAFQAPIATRIDPAGPFYQAEAYHQDYLVRHPDAPYIAINDIPKVRSLQALFPESSAGQPRYREQTGVGKLVLAALDALPRSPERQRSPSVTDMPVAGLRGSRGPFQPTFG